MSSPGKPGTVFPLQKEKMYLGEFSYPESDLLLWYRQFLELFSHFVSSIPCTGNGCELPPLAVHQLLLRQGFWTIPFLGRISNEPDETLVCL